MMTDRVSRERRSKMMAQVKNKDTSPEKQVRSWLHQNGYRFSLHRKDLPGRPDIVLPKYRTAIFVNGCFWHRHEGCKYATLPKSNTKFWHEKLQRNVQRDRKNISELEAMSWKVFVVWGCEVKKEVFVQKLKNALSSTSH